MHQSSQRKGGNDVSRMDQSGSLAAMRGVPTKPRMEEFVYHALSRKRCVNDAVTKVVQKMASLGEEFVSRTEQRLNNVALEDDVRLAKKGGVCCIHCSKSSSVKANNISTLQPNAGAPPVIPPLQSINLG